MRIYIYIGKLEKVKHFISLLLDQQQQKNQIFILQQVDFFPKVHLNVIIRRNRKKENHAFENERFTLVEKTVFEGTRVMLSGEKNVEGWP